MHSRDPSPLVRILVSETDNWLSEMIAALTHDIARTGISVAAVIPPTVYEDDLLETAAKQKFDVAVILLNNVFYRPYDTKMRINSLVPGSLRLVKTMVSAFGIPVIGLYGSPDDDGYAAEVLSAGATAVFRIPCPPEDIQQGLKRCLDIW